MLASVRFEIDSERIQSLASGIGPILPEKERHFKACRKAVRTNGKRLNSTTNF